MLSLYASNGSMVEDKMLRHWVDYIDKDRSDLNIRGVAIVYESGHVAAATTDFKVSVEEIKNIQRTYTNQDEDRICFRGVTFCVKSRDSDQLVCFNGNKYVIVNRTQKTFIITYCVSKQKSIKVAKWINNVAKKIKARRT